MNSPIIPIIGYILDNSNRPVPLKRLIKLWNVSLQVRDCVRGFLQRRLINLTLVSNDNNIIFRAHQSDDQTLFTITGETEQIAGCLNWLLKAEVKIRRLDLMSFRLNGDTLVNQLNQIQLRDSPSIFLGSCNCPDSRFILKKANLACLHRPCSSLLREFNGHVDELKVSIDQLLGCKEIIRKKEAETGIEPYVIDVNREFGRSFRLSCRKLILFSADRHYIPFDDLDVFFKQTGVEKLVLLPSESKKDFVIYRDLGFAIKDGGNIDPPIFWEQQQERKISLKGVSIEVDTSTPLKTIAGRMTTWFQTEAGTRVNYRNTHSASFVLEAVPKICEQIPTVAINVFLNFRVSPPNIEKYRDLYNESPFRVFVRWVAAEMGLKGFELRHNKVTDDRLAVIGVSRPPLFLEISVTSVIPQ